MTGHQIQAELKTKYQLKTGPNQQGVGLVGFNPTRLAG